MKRNLFNIFTLFTLLVGHLIPAKATPYQATVQYNYPTPSAIQVLRSDKTGVTLALETPVFSLERSDSDEYDLLSVPGGDMWGQSGHPQLPVFSGLIGVPPGAEVSIQPSLGEGTLLEGRYTLPAGPRPLPLDGDLEPGRMIAEPDPAAYAINAWIPENPVQLGEEAWIRDQRVFRVSIFPFQYNPAQQSLRWFEHVQVDISFSGGRVGNAIFESRFENVYSGSLLNYDSAKFFRMPPASLNLKSPSSIFQSLGPRFDFAVDQDGVYRVTYANLQAAGMDVDSVNPFTFHLYNQGQDVAIHVAGEGDGSFDPGDYIAFYGEKFYGDILAERYADSMTRPDSLPANNWFWMCVPGTCDLAGAFEQYTDENIYSLTTGGTPGPRMVTINGSPLGAQVPDVFTTTVRAEQSNYWWAYEFQSEDVWFWDLIQQPTSSLPFTSSYPINLSGIASGYQAIIHAEMASRVSTTGFPDHHTQFKINSSPTIFGDTYWDGRIRQEMTASIPQSDLVEGVNTLHFTMLPDVAPGVTQMYFDFFEITYTREFVAENNQLTFTRHEPGTWQYEIDGFTTPTIEVYDVTNPLLPKRVLNPVATGSNPYQVKFQATHGAKASYHVTSAGSIMTLPPASITKYMPPDFANMADADYLFITHKDFIVSLQPLVAFRESQGLSVEVVNVEDLYREFNDGIYHPIAIKNFLAFTFENWQTPPTYVALVGSGHWNFKDYGTFGAPPIYMPPNLAYVDPWQGQTDSANLLTTIVGDDTLPDLHISRIPVSSPAEMENIVNKIMSYETQPIAAWQRNITLITDNTPDPEGAGDFVALAENIINNFLTGDPYYQPVRIYENDYGCPGAGCADVTFAITNTINTQGSLLVNYIGHAAVNRWSGESIFLNEDVATMNNPNHLPVILSMTCLDGYWLHPSTESLAQVFLTSKDKGAVGTYSPTGLGVATGHDSLQHGFFKSLFNRGEWELGNAVLNSKVELYLSNDNFDLMHTFTLFGDPALHLASPYGVKLNPETAQKNALAGETVTYSLILSNPGIVTDSYTVTLTGDGWNIPPSPFVIGPVTPGGNTSFNVPVDIPSNAQLNDQNILLVLAVSWSDVHKTAASQLITTVGNYKKYFPIILQP